MVNTGLREAILDEIRDAARCYDADKVVLFGSRARGDHKDRSDIDLAVYGGDFSRLALEIDEETDTLLKFDIVNMQKPITRELKDSITNEGITIYEKIR